MRALRDSLDRPESVAVFGSGMVPEHGIFQAGWALAVAVDLARASGTPADADDVRRRAAVVESALRGSRSGFLEGYPGQYWPCDTVVAASALADAAVLLDRPDWLDTVRTWRGPGCRPRRPDHRPAAAPGRRRRPAARGSAWLVAVDHPGVLAGRRAGTGRPGRSRRLGGVPADASWSARPGWSAYASTRAGSDGPGDVDSGPLLLGVSASASTVTLAAARAIGDTELADDLSREAELLGLPSRWGGERRYALGLLPVGDAFLAWARTRPLELVPQIGGDETSVRPWWPCCGPFLVPLVALVWWVAGPRFACEPGNSRSTRET